MRISFTERPHTSEESIEIFRGAGRIPIKNYLEIRLQGDTTRVFPKQWMTNFLDPDGDYKTIRGE